MGALQLGFLIWVLGSRPAAAETFPFIPHSPHTNYKVSANEIVAIVRHPFRVVRLESHNLVGTATFIPGQFEKGLRYNIELRLNGLDSPTGVLGAAVVQMLGSKSIWIFGESIDLVKLAKSRDEPSIAVIRPKVDIAGHVSYPEVNLRITQDGKVVRWEIKSEFTLTDFKIPVPRKWDIPAEDKVVLTGELSFTPKD